MKKILIVSLMLIFVFALSAENSLDYLEGFLEMQDSSGWTELYIGDEIPSNAVLRLTDNGYAEILVGEAIVSLINDGNYDMQELVSSVSGIGSSSMDLKKKLTMNTDYEKWQQEATMGVRGAEQSTFDMSTGMEDAFTYLNAGLELLMDGEYKDALVNFEEGWEFFEDDNCLLFAAVCYEALGQKRDYARSLQNVTGEYLDAEFKATYAIRKSDLLMRSLSYQEAVDLLKDFIDGSYDASDDEVQKIHYLLGKGYLGLGNKPSARSEFETSRKLGPGTDVGKLAKDALTSL